MAYGDLIFWERLVDGNKCINKELNLLEIIDDGHAALLIMDSWNQIMDNLSLRMG